MPQGNTRILVGRLRGHGKREGQVRRGTSAVHTRTVDMYEVKTTGSRGEKGVHMVQNKF